MADIVRRRTLLEWMGRATVLALASPLLKACEVAGYGRADAGPDLSGPTGDPGTEAPGDPAFDAAACGEGAFAPGPTDLAVYEGWGERTVDPQDLARLLATWRLEVGGLVDRPQSFSFCELRDLGLVRQVTDFHCVEGWSVLDVPWDGVPLSRLLDLARPRPGAGWLTFRSAGGKYMESLALSVAREPRTIVGLGVDGHTLPLAHGFPCRIVIPRLFGYKNAKYVARIDLDDEERTGFWPAYGYPTSGEVPPSRLRDGKY